MASFGDMPPHGINVKEYIVCPLTREICTSPVVCVRLPEVMADAMSSDELTEDSVILDISNEKCMISLVRVLQTIVDDEARSIRSRHTAEWAIAGFTAAQDRLTELPD